MYDYNTSGSSGPPYWRSSTRQHQTIGLTINGTYRLLGRNRGLYAIAGVGVYQQWTEVRSLDFPGSEEVRRFNSASLGANLGLGYDFMALGREMFVEGRLHSGLGGQRVPLSVGIRF
jgi:hypothetical protein